MMTEVHPAQNLKLVFDKVFIFFRREITTIKGQTKVDIGVKIGRMRLKLVKARNDHNN